MLTVNASKRATVEEICSHWWVDEGFTEPCLEVAEALANQTPVRLDLLLSLAPKHINSEHMLIQPEEEDSARVSVADETVKNGVFSFAFIMIEIQGSSAISKAINLNQH